MGLYYIAGGLNEMYDKGLETVFRILCVFVGIIIGAMFLLCSGCKSSRAVDGQILEYQRQIDKLESELRDRDRTIEDCARELRNITERSEAMGTDIDSIIRELDEYQRTVQRLLQSIGERTDKE